MSFYCKGFGDLLNSVTYALRQTENIETCENGISFLTDNIY